MVWNPTTGCLSVSPGCDHCYARRITERFSGPGSFEHIVLHPERLERPLHWHRPRRIFVNSMSDLFHAKVPEEFILSVWSVMDRAGQHTFQVLTKRAERMERIVSRFYPGPRVRLVHPPEFENWLPNVWLGVSVESPAYYSRIHHLQRTPAAVRFLSCEPLLAALPELPLEGIDWVIVGGESGPGARPMHIHWVRDIRDQCVRAGVPFFFKQWGEWGPASLPTRKPTLHIPCPPGCDENAWLFARVGKHAAGRLLDGRTWDEYPPPFRGAA
jgi:protein gp37